MIRHHDKIEDDKVFARHEGNFMYVDAEKINYIDLSPKQLVSVSTALIPFLEHDDATVRLWVQTCNVKLFHLLDAQAPIVGTGMETEIAKASGAVITAKRAGVVEYVSSEKIVIRADEDEFRNVEDWICTRY